MAKTKLYIPTPVEIAVNKAVDTLSQEYLDARAAASEAKLTEQRKEAQLKTALIEERLDFLLKVDHSAVARYIRDELVRK